MAKEILVIISFALMQVATAHIIDVIKFFPEVGTDASKVSWGHRINSQSALASSINDSNIMMLEADVLGGQLVGTENSNELLPIMAHPPEKTSDLSMEQWLKRVIEAVEQGNKKGAKLDFKDVNIIETSLMILKNYSSEIHFPLWMNADILVGPGGQAGAAIDPRTFLTLCKEYFPSATLSIGWTTGFSSDIEYTYSRGMIEEMSKAIQLHNIQQPITFPVRAALIKNSIRNLMKLMDLVPNCTFTIWSPKTDVVDMKAVANLIEIAGKNRVYIDIPNEQMAALNHVLRADNLPESPTTAGTSWAINRNLFLLFLPLLLLAY